MVKAQGICSVCACLIEISKKLSNSEVQNLAHSGCLNTLNVPPRAESLTHFQNSCLEDPTGELQKEFENMFTFKGMPSHYMKIIDKGGVVDM
jgi:hypothetical protein